MKTETENLRELDAWIAEHVMGWKWYCALGKAFLIPPFAQERFDDFSVHWTEGVYEKGWTRIEPEKKACEKRFDIESFYSDYDYCSIPRFSTDPASSMLVLTKCAEKLGSMEWIGISWDDGQWKVRIVHSPWEDFTDDTLPLAICKLSKQLFSK